MTFFLGLDLGQASDPTAIAILERFPIPSEKPPAELTFRIPEGGIPSAHWPLTRSSGPPKPVAFHCRHLERLKLGTPYPAVADYVSELLDASTLKGRTELVVDATGVGRPVVDMLRQRGLEPVGITITGGDAVVSDLNGGWRVPKRDLVAAVQVLLQNKWLKFAESLPAVPDLVKEMLAFRVKIDPLTAHDSYGAWREGAHDDLVLAVAVAAWYGQRWEPFRPRTGLASGSFYVGW
jgi:hypothetical protein